MQPIGVEVFDLAEELLGMKRDTTTQTPWDGVGPFLDFDGQAVGVPVNGAGS
jgi:hypothetical protein